MAAPQEGYDLTANRAARSDNELVSDNIIGDCNIAMFDNINAAWNGWETACKFQDEDLAAYYMKIIVIMNDGLQKLRRVKK